MVLKTTACVAHGTTNIEVSMFWFETFTYSYNIATSV